MFEVSKFSLLLCFSLSNVITLRSVHKLLLPRALCDPFAEYNSSGTSGTKHLRGGQAIVAGMYTWHCGRENKINVPTHSTQTILQLI